MEKNGAIIEPLYVFVDSVGTREVFYRNDLCKVVSWLGDEWSHLFVRFFLFFLCVISVSVSNVHLLPTSPLLILIMRMCDYQKI